MGSVKRQCRTLWISAEQTQACASQMTVRDSAGFRLASQVVTKIIIGKDGKMNELDEDGESQWRLGP